MGATKKTRLPVWSVDEDEGELEWNELVIYNGND